MNIVIFEDDKLFRSVFEKIINKVKPTNNYIILSTASTKEIENYVERNDSATLYFLDLFIDEKMIGTKIAKLIRKKNKANIIAYITFFPEELSYDSDAKMTSLNFIHKNSPKLTEEVKQTIDMANYMLSDKAALVIESRYGGIFRVHLEDIYYIETIKGQHKIRLYYANGIYECRNSITEMLKKLDDRFIRCHHGFIVNKDKINIINKSQRQITLDNGLVCYYSYRYEKGLKNGVR